MTHAASSLSSRRTPVPIERPLSLALAVLIAGSLVAQQTPRAGLVDDWTTHHLIFSNPGTAVEASAQGRYAQWYKTVNNSRYVMQQRKRNNVSTGPEVKESFASDSMKAFNPPHKQPGPRRDWAVSLGTGTVAENMYPAKFTFSSIGAPNCTTDYVAYGLNVAGSTGHQANMVALNNLYSGTLSTSCTGHTTATPYWAYNVSFAGGAITTSPALSEDGSKVIFVESGGTTGPYLHILVWNSADAGTPTVSVAPAKGLTSQVTSLSGCTVGSSCLVSILLNSTTETVTNSSPFYDYNDDTVYVGDDAGNMYKVTPVLGSATPVVTKLNVVSTVGTDTSVMTGPTYDYASGYVFVAASNGALYGITASSFSSATALQIGDTSCTSSGYNRRMTDAPTVDSANGWVYEYITDNASDNTVVEQASTAGPFTTTNAVTVGQGDNACNSGTFFPTHTVAFDNNYYTGTTGSSGTIEYGHIWVCGRAASGSAAELWEIPTSAKVSSSYTGSISGVTAVSNSSQISETSHAQCSPFTEIENGATDYLFFGEGLTGSFGSLYGFTLNDSASTTEAAALFSSGDPYTVPTATGGTSGIVIDNTSAAAQASSIYFTTLATGTPCASGNYCAIKLTQSALN